MNRQWSEVSGSLLWAFAWFFGFAFRFQCSDGLQVGIKTRSKFINERLDPLHLRFFDELAAERASEKMLCFLERPARRSDEASVILITAASGPFRDVRPHAVSRADQLASHSVSRENVPPDHQIPDFIGQLFRESIYPQTFECALHRSFLVLISLRLVAPARYATDD